MRERSKSYLRDYGKFLKQSQQAYEMYKILKEAEDLFKIGKNIIFIKTKKRAVIISGYNGSIDFVIQHENGSSQGMNLVTYKTEWEYVE